MKKSYIAPEAAVASFNDADIITASLPTEDFGEGDVVEWL